MIEPWDSNNYEKRKKLKYRCDAFFLNTKNQYVENSFSEHNDFFYFSFLFGGKLTCCSKCERMCGIQLCLI